MSLAAAKKGARIPDNTHDTLSLPPDTLLNGASLFLDLDGTLLDLVDRPEDVVVDAALRSLLVRLERWLEGRLAVVSGRSLAQLDAILGPAAENLALSGSHGSEHRWRGISAQPKRPATLDEAARRLSQFIARYPGTLIEEKSYGVALHYRMRPEAQQDARKLAWDIAHDLDLYLQDGKMMVELRVPGGNKGAAIRRLMNRPPMRGTIPIFIGDDRTDEEGFEAVAELGGAGILVGEARETAARYRLPQPVAVRAWLAGAMP